MIVANEKHRQKAIELIQKWKLSKPMELIGKPYKYDKTKEQRNWFHSLCRMFGKETGYTEGEIKDYVKQAYFGTKEVKIGKQVKVVADGSSEGLKREPYSELIETLYRLAAEAEIPLPAPNRMRTN